MDTEKLDDLRATGIEPLADPESVFNQLKARFDPKETSEPRIDPPSLANVLQAKGGYCKALTFLLLNLFRSAGIDAELVITSVGAQHKLTDVFSLNLMDHVLVYVPSLDRYFDPTRPASRQRERDQAIRTLDRFHVAGPPTDIVRSAGGCADYCVLPGIPVVERGNHIDRIPVKTEKIQGHSSSPQTFHNAQQ